MQRIADVVEQWERPAHDRVDALQPWSAVAQIFFAVAFNQEEGFDPHLTIPDTDHDAVELSLYDRGDYLPASFFASPASGEGAACP